MPYNPFYIENGTGFEEWLKDDFVGHYDNLTLKTYVFEDSKKRYTIYFGELNLEILKVMEIETFLVGNNSLRVRYSTGEWETPKLLEGHNLEYPAPKTARMVPNWYNLKTSTATRLINGFETLDFWSHFIDLLKLVWHVSPEILAGIFSYRSPKYQSWMEPLPRMNAEEFAYQISKSLAVLEERLKVTGEEVKKRKTRSDKLTPEQHGARVNEFNRLWKIYKNSRNKEAIVRMMDETPSWKTVERSFKALGLEIGQDWTG